ncbi:ABC transporter permease [Sporosarcina sp. FSL W7-1349]|uniref:ABC transporter permease n=1 Tax=Sporosarcina sp. FSL W7-1349 TaxID=2921561 RepID=UPI0030F4CC8D
MTFSWKRVSAIFIKDYKDFSRNMAVSIVIFMPLLLAAFYGRMGVQSIDTFFMLFNLSFTMVATFVQCCLIAEEKEKNTLRGLMLSPASTLEILSGKSLLSFLSTALVIIFSAFLAEYHPANIGIIGIALLLSSFFYIGLGTLLGLFAKSVMEASVYILPVMLLFSFGSSITSLADRYPVLEAANYLPNIQLIEIATKVEAGAQFSDVLLPLGWILLWGIVVFIATFLLYRKRMVD